jgi:hypothetical protein
VGQIPLNVQVLEFEGMKGTPSTKGPCIHDSLNAGPIPCEAAFRPVSAQVRGVGFEPTNP